MRLVGIALAVVLSTSTAYANTNPLPFDIVRMLPETKQVLVYDRASNKHVLLEPGATFDDYVIIDISGFEMIVEKEQQRFAVYPRDAKLLALSVLPRDLNTPARPPVIYGKSVPAPVLPQVADAKTIDTKTRVAKTIDAKTTDAKTSNAQTVDPNKQVARDLASVLAFTPPRTTPRPPTPASSSTLHSAKLKP
jgi:hypothetical protein